MHAQGEVLSSILTTLSGQLQELCSNSAAFSNENANVSCSTHLIISVDCPPQLKQQLHELQLRLERQAAQVIPHFLQVFAISMRHNWLVRGRRFSSKTNEPASTGSPRTAGGGLGVGV